MLLLLFRPRNTAPIVPKDYGPAPDCMTVFIGGKRLYVASRPSALTISLKRK